MNKPALRKVKQVYVDAAGAIVFELEDGSFLAENQCPTGSCWSFNMSRLEYATITPEAKEEIASRFPLPHAQ